MSYDLSKSPPARAVSTPIDDPSQDKEEWLCFDFARELLMPRNAVALVLKYEAAIPSLENLLGFCRRFDVSIALACRRIFRDLKIWDDAAVFLVESSGSRLVSRPKEIFKGKKTGDLHVGAALIAKIQATGAITEASSQPRAPEAKVISSGRKRMLLEVRQFDIMARRFICLIRRLEGPLLRSSRLAPNDMVS